MQTALVGHGALVMMGGEPGVGKSRLAQEIAGEGQARGFRVFTGRCYEGHGDLPYMPWVEIVEAAARDTPAEFLRDALGDAGPELARLVPQLRRVFPDIPPPLELPSDQQRRYMFSCLGDHIGRLATSQPRLYVLEDLHWADDATLLFLRYLVERLSTLPVLVVGTYRDLPIDVSPLLAETMSDFVRSRRAHLVSLRRHSESEVEGLLGSLSGHGVPAAVTEAFFAETEGNAFFVEELFRHLVEAGRLFDDRGGFRSDLRVGELDVPRNVRLVTGQRLDRLSEVTRRLLTVGAVIGRRFRFSVMEAVAELDDEAILNAVDEAEQAHLLFSESGGREAQIWFSHELVRQTLLTRLSAPRRQRIHLRVADALERIHADDAALHASDIAHHLVQAGAAADPVRTAGHLALAGDRALEAAAFEEALRHFEHALALLPEQELRRRAESLGGLGRAHRSLSHWDEAMVAWEQSIRVLDALGDKEAEASACWEVGLQLGWSQRFAEMAPVVRRGLALGGDANRARMLTLKAIALAGAGGFDEAGVCIVEATRLAAAESDDHLLAQVDFAEMFQYFASMRPEQSIAPARNAAERLRRAGALWLLADVLPILYFDLVYLGRFGEAEEVAAEAVPLVERLGHSAAAASTRRADMQRRAAQSADLATLDMMATASWKMAQSTGSQFWLGLASTGQGIVSFWHGDWAEARRQLEQGAQLAAPGFWFGCHHGALCLFSVFDGNPTQALTILDQVSDSLPRPGRVNALGQWNLALFGAEAVGLLMDTDRARHLYPMVVEALTTGTLLRMYDGGLLRRTAAMAAAAAGLPEQAEEHFEEAMRQAHELPHLIERPTVRHFYARFLMRRGGSGDVERARTFLEEAATGYRSIGMPRHVAMAEELLEAFRAR
jgi:tetratricopeptide (TPR) repeat protein